MEKINTPLMAEIYVQKTVLRIEQGRRDRGEEHSPKILFGAIYAIEVLEFLIQKEREVIVKTYAAGQDNYRQFTLDRLKNRLTYDEQYFTQTFKSYE